MDNKHRQREHRVRGAAAAGGGGCWGFSTFYRSISRPSDLLLVQLQDSSLYMSGQVETPEPLSVLLQAALARLGDWGVICG